jgi:UDP-N-acetylmuramoyl-tripeptide--D-alanyl-D-alanine ligase
VAQREHYLSPSVSRFAWRWWVSSPVNLALFVSGVVGVVGTLWSVWAGFLVAVAQVGPVGLSVKGTTSTLNWTARLRRLAVAVTMTVLACYLVGGITANPFVVVVGLALLPALFDLAMLALAPLERALGSKWVDRARVRLESVAPEVVAVTGSYGKTTTKGYITHLLSGERRVVASPASFNNRLGLARAINEHLVPGTEVFVAEMGTYGRGEIAEMCTWVKPTVGVIVSLGPVHLERFRTEERILDAKAEILDRATVGVVCVDHPLLAGLATRLSSTMPIIEVSTGDRGRVRVQGGALVVDGEHLAEVSPDVFGANLAAAFGVCLALGVDVDTVRRRLDGLPTPPHRQSVAVGETGAKIIDDTFNSNPEGARRALGLLVTVGGGAKVVVTPGMVELGPVQASENEALAREAAGVADHLIVVGATNRAALLRGAADGRAAVTVVGSREAAVAWVRAHLGPGDAVLYENDLPDHYP